MAKGLQSWSVKESGAPVTKAEIITSNADNLNSFSSTTRAIMGVAVTASGFVGTMTITLASGSSFILPNKASIDAVFAPGGIVPFACDSFQFSASDSTFTVVGLF